MGERHLEAISWVIMTVHTGHHDLSVIQPSPNLSSSSKNVASIWLTDEIHNSSGHPWEWWLYTHPPSHPGACFSSQQEGWAPILLLLLSLTNFVCTHPSKSVQSYPSCSSTQFKNQTCSYPKSISPQMPRLSTPWPQMSLMGLVQVGINITTNDFNFCTQYKRSCTYPTCLPPKFCSNMVKQVSDDTRVFLILIRWY